jgi:uncharacterized protein (TIGR03905 family)
MVIINIRQHDYWEEAIVGISYKPSGVCAKEFIFHIENNTIEDIDIIGGCPGNLVGLTSLIKGMKIEDVIEKLHGITCGQKDTSCPDQLAQVLKEYLEKQVA